MLATTLIIFIYVAYMPLILEESLAVFSIPDEDKKNNTVIGLLELLREYDLEVSNLRDEIARLKGNPAKPKLKPSKIAKNDPSIAKKRNKKFSTENTQPKKIKIHEEITLQPDNIPVGSRLVKVHSYTVQDIKIEPHNTKYLRQIWQSPDGRYIRASLPETLKGHYGNTLKAYILNLHYGSHVTQHDILTQLRDIGISLSSGKISNILTKNHDIFHEEAEDILQTGLKHSEYISVDDTGLRHKNKNGYCTHVGNESFAYFKSSDNKSRLNFLKILRGNSQGYCINVNSLNYLKLQKFPQEKLDLLKRLLQKNFLNADELTEYLKQFGITNAIHIRSIFESGLIGFLYEKFGNLRIVSDGAGQFKVFIRAACWIHSERKINSLIPVTDEQVKLQLQALDNFWRFYKILKSYKESNSYRRKQKLIQIFDKLCTQETSWSSLNKQLKLLHNDKQYLLRVLDYPLIPLHTNQSESDIREVVKKRKISFGTQSFAGRQCRDTFISLKKTCKKQGFSFWEYLLDRVTDSQQIKPLSQLIILDTS